MSPNAPSSKPAARRPHTRPRRWIPYALGGLLIALLIAGFRPRPVPVETGIVDRGPLRTVVQEEGRTRIRERFRVSAPVAGQLRRLPLKEGAEVVAQTTVIAIIDPIRPPPLDARSRSLAVARRDAIAAQVEKARTALRFAAGDRERFERLFREGSVSAQELESFQWREAAAAQELAAAESALREAEAELADHYPTDAGNAPDGSRPVELLAPTSGRILRVFEENARVVTPGVPILELGDPADLEVVIEVLSRDGAAIAPGTPVELTHWGGPQPLQARVRHVEPAAFTKVSALGVEEQRVNVVANLVTPPAQRPGLGDQFRVEAHIVTWSAMDTLRAPSGALFRQGTNWAAYGIIDGRARLRTVRAGHASPEATQILDGLDEGDTVILYPGDRITDGIRVRPLSLAP
ncbi:MAG: HlyD family efflux transporter periplasmic adaptor subunit [Verrucomicrobiae bacterium]|nr:HlyD family efflux transporter periplasmic adaptor subunit [Verrucomicrobiae bacterium]